MHAAHGMDISSVSCLHGASLDTVSSTANFPVIDLERDQTKNSPNLRALSELSGDDEIKKVTNTSVNNSSVMNLSSTDSSNTGTAAAISHQSSIKESDRN
eukprot:CAMPEP_0117597076 /NCGR_PEP_ID=MMETSP0784-20121206/74661_1 /TAXON_ID=39447 /ORGANISM="" /LENGTH=99 /DNA_ID=CAMNT_0005399417 /DNA_START=137 /DNA_END=433 /DNA_ORIENTATION=-